MEDMIKVCVGGGREGEGGREGGREGDSASVTGGQDMEDMIKVW